MSLITNIKYQYHSKILKDFVSSNNYYDFFKALNKQKNNKKLYIRLLSEFLIEIIKNPNFDLLESKIVWVNSFIEEDTVYLNNFLQSYINKIEQVNLDTLYEHCVVKILKKIEQPQSLSFNDFVNFSYLYQYLIVDENNNSLKVINNQLPFFSTPQNLNFTNSSLTQCYFYIVDHPYSVYQKLKKENNNELTSTRSDFLNIDNHSFKKNIDGVLVEMNKMGWHTHFNSWTDSNVINSLNGKVIFRNNLVNYTYDTLSSIVLHLIQSGADLKMDYEFIENYVSNNPIDDQIKDHSMSQKEKKFIDQYLDNILKSYNF